MDRELAEIEDLITRRKAALTRAIAAGRELTPYKAPARQIFCKPTTAKGQII